MIHILSRNQNLTRSQRKDVLFGWPVSEALTPFHVGRTLLVKERSVLSVETIEGMVEAIRRAGTVAHHGFAVFLNAANGPQPPEPIGREVFDAMVETKADVLVLSEKYPFIDSDDFMMKANQAGITVVNIISSRDRE